MSDKLILSAGPMCGMTFLHHGPIDEVSVWDVLDFKKNAFIHFVNGNWIFNVKKYWSWLQPLANAGISQHRIALYCVGSLAPRSQLFMPWYYVSSADAFNLLVKNQPFFDVLRQMAIETNKMKVQLMVCVMNECEERKPARKEQSPFYHNINGVDGLYDNKALPYIGTLTDWILEALAGTDFAIELINEGHRRGSGSVEAVEVMLPKLYAAGVKPWDISLGADVVDYTYSNPDIEFTKRWPNEPHPPKFENYDFFMNRLVKVYDPKYPNATHEAFYVSHNFADDAPKEYGKERPYGARTDYTKVCWIDHNLASNRVCFSTDGTDFADAPSGRPSPARMKAAMLYVMRSNPQYKKTPLINGRPKLWFDFLPKGETIPDQVKIVDAMNEVHKEFFGEDLENRGKVPPYVEPEPVIPDPVIEPEPEPKTDITTWDCTILYHLKRLNFKAAFEHLIGKHKWRQT